MYISVYSVRLHTIAEKNIIVRDWHLFSIQVDSDKSMTLPFSETKNYRGRPPGPPLPKNQGIPMLIPHHLNPLSREKDIQGYTPYLGYWLPLAITKNTPFFWFSREIFPRLRPKITPLSPENGNAHAASLCIRVGGRGRPTQHIMHGRSSSIVGWLCTLRRVWVLSWSPFFLLRALHFVAPPNWFSLSWP